MRAPAILALLLATSAQAQAPSPAQMGITSTTSPEVLQTLDSSKTWVPIGTVDPTNHAWTGFGAGTDVRAFGAQVTGTLGSSADPAGTFDNTPALNAACASHLLLRFPPGKYHVKDMISCNGQIISGAGRNQAILDVGSDFNLSAAGVLNVAAGAGLGSEVHDLGIECYQNPADTLQSQLIQYPWAITGSTQGARPILDNIYIGRCWNGIGFIGNFAPITQGILQLGVFNTPFEIDGARDYTFINAVEIWPFGLAGLTNLINIWNANLPTSIIGRVDGLVVNQWTMFDANLTFNQNANGCAVGGEFNTLHLNGLGTITVNHGCFNVGVLALEQDTTETVPALIMNGPSATDTMFNVSNLRGTSSNAVAHLIENHGGDLIVNGGKIYFNPGNTIITADSSIGGSRTVLSNLTLRPAPIGTGGGIITAPTITQATGASLVAHNIQNSVSAGANTAPIIQIGSDNASNRLDNLNFVAMGNATVSVVLNPTGVLGWYDIPRVLFAITATPSMTTMGTFAPTSNVVTGYYKLRGDHVDFEMTDAFTTNAYTGAVSPFFIATNLPVSVLSGSDNDPPMPIILGSMSNVTYPAGTTVTAQMRILNPNAIQFPTISSAAAWGQLGTTNILPSTAGVNFKVGGSYPIK